MTTNGPRIALVTGAARRIGRAIAMALAEDGWGVAVHYNSSAADAEETVADIRAAGGVAEALPCDLGDWDSCEDLIERTLASLGPVTCLVNNASIFEEDSPATVTPESWDRHLAVNLRAPFVLSQAMMRCLPDGITANIINIIDQRVWNLTPDFTSYTVSKVGLWGLTRSLARSLAPHIRVNAVGPGPTLQSIHQTPEEFEAEWVASPLERPVRTDDICRAVRFILDAQVMTGQMIALDSGQHMGTPTLAFGREKHR